VGVALVVKDVAPGNRGAREVPDEDFLAQREIAESVCVHLHHAGFVDALEEVSTIGRG
jgi:hypothetical protein